MQTRCIVKARPRKVHFSGDFLGGFDFLRSACSLGIPQENPLNLIKSPIFTNAPCKTACLYNAPSMHTVEFRPLFLSALPNLIFLRRLGSEIGGVFTRATRILVAQHCKPLLSPSSASPHRSHLCFSGIDGYRIIPWVRPRPIFLEAPRRPMQLKPGL